jgi:PAS domain S-box-containing protein
MAAWVIVGILLSLSTLFVGSFLAARERQHRETASLLRQQTARERLVSQIAQQIRQSLNLDEVLATTVAEVQRFLQADRVLIYRLQDNGTGCAIHEAVLPEYPRVLGQTFPEEVFPREYHQAYLLGKTRTIVDIEQADVEDCLADFVKQFGVRSKMVVPIIQDLRLHAEESPRPYLWGLLIAHQCSRPRQWKIWEVELMQQLATQVAIAIYQSELYNQLQELNRDLETRVLQRTQELGAANMALRAKIVERQRTEAALRQTNIAIQRDVAARRLAEQALRQSEERFRSLIENALDIIMILDQDGTIRYVSPSFESVLGYSVTEPIGAKLLDWIHPDDIASTLTHLAALVKAGTAASELTRSLEFRCRHLDQSWRTMEAISRTFVDSRVTADSGETLQIMVNARDITERRRLEEIRIALEREKELNVLKTRFFSMASHEFRTPLSTALAAAQVLENSSDVWQDSEKRKRNLRRIQDAVNNMVQMLNDILTINRAETGKLDFRPKRLDLENFCHHLIEEMRLSAGSSYQFIFTRSGTATPVYLDEKLLNSILSNLLWNAVKYSPQGGEVRLTLEFQPTVTCLQVEDQGIGIPLEDHAQLFEPFHRGKNVRSIPGTGLGLVVVQKCVELHQGTIAISSEVGQGTTCRVTLPLR